MFAAGPAQLRILVVDDDDANLLFLEKALSRKGHQIVLAHTGEEALSLYERVEPDLVLMDVMLPGWDGFETTRRIRVGGGHRGRWVPLIFLSAIGRTPDMVKGLAAGGDDYLVKPVDLSLLESKIAAMQRIAALQRELEHKNSDLAHAQAINEQQKQTSAKIFNRLMRMENIAQRHIQFRVMPNDVFSGDLVSAAQGPDGSLYLMLADAAGHGLDAATTVLPLVSTFQTLSEQGHSLGRIAREINQRLHHFLPPSNFVAAVLVRTDPTKMLLEVLNAGMPPAHQLSHQGTLLRAFPSAYLPFGLQSPEQDAYQPATAFALPGHQVVLCSDGLVEALSGNNKEFGVTGMLAALEAAHADDSRMASVLAAYDRHRAGRPAKDDASIAVLTIPEWPVGATAAEAAKGSPTAASTFPSSFQLTLSPDQLRDPDLLSNVVTLLSSVKLVPANRLGSFFSTVKELLANAVDYGLLGMESRAALGQHESRWSQWRDLRQQRLSALSQGCVTLVLDVLPSAPDQARPRWRFQMRDSGPGFKYQDLPSNGGLVRVSNFWAHSLSFNAEGNSVVVEFD